MFSPSLSNFSFSSYVLFRISLNCSPAFFCISLSIPRTIILNSLSGSSCIFIYLGSVTRGLLYSFVGAIFSWFFMIPVALCRWLSIWRRHQLFQTLWIEVGKKRPSPVNGGMLEQAVTMCLVMQGTNCGWCMVARGAGGMVTCWLMLLSCIASTVVWSLASTAEGPQRLQGQCSSSAVTSGPVARDQGMHWW